MILSKSDRERCSAARYHQIQVFDFKDIVKIALLADPSQYAGEETTVGIMYSWERQKAAWGMIQVMIFVSDHILGSKDTPDPSNPKDKLFPLSSCCALSPIRNRKNGINGLHSDYGIKLVRGEVRHVATMISAR